MILPSLVVFFFVLRFSSQLSPLLPQAGGFHKEARVSLCHVQSFGVLSPCSGAVLTRSIE